MFLFTFFFFTIYLKGKSKKQRGKRGRNTEVYANACYGQRWARPNLRTRSSHQVSMWMAGTQLSGHLPSQVWQQNAGSWPGSSTTGCRGPKTQLNTLQGKTHPKLVFVSANIFCTFILPYLRNLSYPATSEASLPHSGIQNKVSKLRAGPKCGTNAHGLNPASLPSPYPPALILLHGGSSESTQWLKSVTDRINKQSGKICRSQNRLSFYGKPVPIALRLGSPRVVIRWHWVARSLCGVHTPSPAWLTWTWECAFLLAPRWHLSQSIFHILPHLISPSPACQHFLSCLSHLPWFLLPCMKLVLGVLSALD